MIIIKHKTVVILAVLIFVLTIPASAAQERSPAVMPSLTFNGATATCTVSVYGDYTTDKIEVNVELWQDTTLIKSWSDEGEEYVDSVRRANVTKGKEYTLKAYATINGKDLPMAYITKAYK